MTTPTAEVRLMLSESTARKLHEIAQARGIPEETLVEQALALLFSSDDAPSLNNYWFSISTMREDWDAMPEDWIADGADDAVSSR